jgi:site-specific DNA-methyltransferase (adenine-specific)
MELNKIYNEDCIKGLKKLPNDSAQIIIVDPPYNIGKNFGNNKDKKELNEYLEWCDKWINECIRILKPNGTMFIYGFSEILAYLFTRITTNKRWLIWHYTNKNMPSQKFWQRSHESIICCWKEKNIFNENDIREPYTAGFLNGSAGKTRPATIGRLSGKNPKITTYVAHNDGALPRDVIKLPTLAGGSGMSERWFICHTCNLICKPNELKKHKGHNIEKHPTQKPLNLCDKLILSAKQKDGFVLIPFVGSGSECVSAKKNGLNFIGFELNPEYIKLANERIKEIKTQNQSRLF